MVANQLEVSRLMRLHARWMGLNDHFPLVAHCCATQEGHVEISARTTDGEVVEIGSVSSVVLAKMYWRRSDTDLLNANFSGPGDALLFQSSLHAGLWTQISRLPLSQLDLMCSDEVVPYTEVQSIQLSNDEQSWYAHCAFSRDWDDLSNKQKRYEWLDAVGPLAAESLEICRSMFRMDVPAPAEYHSPLNPWLSVVYSSFQPEIRPPRRFVDTCFRCNGAKLDLGNRTVELQRPESAAVMSSTTWLPVDIATASANVLERLLDDMQSGRETSTHRGSQLYGSGWGSVTGSTPPETVAISPDEPLPESLRLLVAAEVGSLAELIRWADDAVDAVRGSDEQAIRMIIDRLAEHAAWLDEPDLIEAVTHLDHRKPAEVIAVLRRISPDDWLGPYELKVVVKLIKAQSDAAFLKQMQRGTLGIKRTSRNRYQIRLSEVRNSDYFNELNNK